MFKKIILSFTICISILCNSLNAFADSSIQIFNNIDNLEVAHIWLDGVNVRALPNIKSKIIDIVNADQQVEVVAKYPGWAKVCLAIDSYGFINDQFLEYRNYAATAPDFYNELVQENLIEPIYEEYEEKSYEEYIEPVYENYSEQIYDNSLNEFQDTSSQNAEVYSYEQVSNYEEQLVYNEENILTDSSIEEEYIYEDEDEEVKEETFYINQETYIEEDNYEVEQEEITYVESSSENSGNYIVDYAKQYVGNPYVYGGTSLTNGTDCSGFTLSVLGDNGITVNGRTAADQAQGGTDVSLDEIEAGDLLFYDNGNGINHVAIYNGDGTVTHASSSDTGIIISDANYRTPVAAKRYW